MPENNSTPTLAAQFILHDLASPLTAWTTTAHAAAELRTVQIWQAALDVVSDAQLAALTPSLDAPERQRAARFQFERDRRRFVAARGILRGLLGRALDVPPAALTFDYGPQGKPTLAARFSAAVPSCAAAGQQPQGELCFNVSHSGGWALFALAWNRAVGIDLEAGERLAARHPAELARLAARILSARELALWQTLPVTLRRAAFLRAWTRKEAYAKATGAGIFAALDRVEVALDPAPSLSFPDGAWLLHDLPAPASGYAAALAVERWQ
ncbi:MAG: 4'-phosphopantetheinyl transferase superfamily protein [Verrucomicrobia bacterium]|nr:4'-phosphopantetheinyl transferase superfamily protein [Verrucomicrobiota bacterium]